MTEERDHLVYYLRIMYSSGYHSERMEEQKENIEIMKKIISLNPILNDDEKILLSVAYKNSVSTRRNSICEVKQHLQDAEMNNYEYRAQQLKEYLNTLKTELKDICMDLIQLVKDTLEPHAVNPELRIFYEKLKADYLRYICECDEDEKEKLADEAKQCYQNALDIAKNELSPISTVYLGVVLNYSVFLYEIMGRTQEAIDLSSRTYQETVDSVDSSNPDYSEIVMILRILGENQKRWMSTNEY